MSVLLIELYCYYLFGFEHIKEIIEVQGEECCADEVNDTNVSDLLQFIVL